MFLFEAPCSGDELSLEAFLFEGFLWDDEIFNTEAHILFIERQVIVVLRVLVIGVFRVLMILLPLVLFGRGLDWVVFGVVRCFIVSDVGSAILCLTRS